MELAWKTIYIVFCGKPCHARFIRKKFLIKVGWNLPLPSGRVAKILHMHFYGRLGKSKLHARVPHQFSPRLPEFIGI